MGGETADLLDALALLVRLTMWPAFAGEADVGPAGERARVALLRTPEGPVAWRVPADDPRFDALRPLQDADLPLVAEALAATPDRCAAVVAEVDRRVAALAAERARAAAGQAAASTLPDGGGDAGGGN